MKLLKHVRVLTPGDHLDITLYVDKGEVIKFALNYRAVIAGKWHEVYRVDNFHGFLHEQRFWRSPKPIILEEDKWLPLGSVVKKYIKEIIKNFQRYRRYFKKK